MRLPNLRALFEAPHVQTLPTLTQEVRDVCTSIPTLIPVQYLKNPDINTDIIDISIMWHRAGR